MSTLQITITVAVIVLATQITRFLPFLLFHNSEKLPNFIKYLSGVLPPATLAILVVYCLKDLNFDLSRNTISTLIAISFIVVLHLWKKQVLLSILGGTLCYMVFLQLLS